MTPPGLTPHLTPRPTPALINGTASWSWLDHTGFGRVAFLLLVHPIPASGETLARALGLSAPGRRLPEIGERIAVAGAGRATVRLDRAGHLMQVAVSERWASFVREGGPTAVLVGLVPLSRDAPREEIETYLADTVRTNRIRLGISRHSYPRR
ncbi:hypothetical protein QMK19_37460 [Streptomyces sp. H10-C2]|uniref:hypothetical protein n=1 Tax=unclassified Streptomyces TaxID=2593676 RepID=UPI0024BA1856|nr:MULTISPECIES: hypothetical protein [unclassified Streptomyces]MDJ0346984.1 hypothetical protein [Streptomyces sp. PH10-H1]MDJ0375145.1 hypothetical protein [Streptomyces sp. H10-C2]